jgi:hypothetical protein
VTKPGPELQDSSFGNVSDVRIREREKVEDGVFVRTQVASPEDEAHKNRQRTNAVDKGEYGVFGF